MTQENVLEVEKKKSLISPAFASVMMISIVALFALIHIGFFDTYIRHFPKFDDYTVEGLGLVHFNWVKHLHGMVMMGWVVMLFTQPLLIRLGKMNLHKQVGRLSYVLAPLVVVFIFLINQNAYLNNVSIAGKPVAVSFIALTFPGLLFFSTLYFLAIRYKHRPALHMRFMCSTAFLFIPPALDRALITYLNLPGFDVGSIILLALTGTVTLIDSLKTKRLSPFAVVFSFVVLHIILWHSRETEVWQTIGGVIAKLF
jgi:hypothetical protein